MSSADQMEVEDEKQKSSPCEKISENSEVDDGSEHSSSDFDESDDQQVDKDNVTDEDIIQNEEDMELNPALDNEDNEEENAESQQMSDTDQKEDVHQEQKPFSYQEMSSPSEADDGSEHSISDSDDSDNQEVEDVINENVIQNEEDMELNPVLDHEDNEEDNAEIQMMKFQRLLKVSYNVSIRLNKRLKKVSITIRNLMDVIGDDTKEEKIIRALIKSIKKDPALIRDALIERRNNLIVYHKKFNDGINCMNEVKDALIRIITMYFNPENLIDMIITDMIDVLLTIHQKIFKQDAFFCQMEREINKLHWLMSFTVNKIPKDFAKVAR